MAVGVARATEKVEQQHIVQLLRSTGWTVYVLGHPSPADGRKHRGTGQTPGLPDLLAFGPDGRQVWVEVKRVGGRLRPEQQEFRERCRHAGVLHVWGTLTDVVGFLLQAGYLTEAQVPWYRLEGRRGQTTPHTAS